MPHINRCLTNVGVKENRKRGQPPTSLPPSCLFIWTASIRCQPVCHFLMIDNGVSWELSWNKSTGNAERILAGASPLCIYIFIYVTATPIIWTWFCNWHNDASLPFTIIVIIINHAIITIVFISMLIIVLKHSKKKKPVKNNLHYLYDIYKLPTTLQGSTVIDVCKL